MKDVDLTPYRVTVTCPGPFAGRSGTARPAFSRGMCHVQLDGDRDDSGRPRDLAFNARELEVLS